MESSSSHRNLAPVDISLVSNRVIWGWGGLDRYEPREARLCCLKCNSMPKSRGKKAQTAFVYVLGAFAAAPCPRGRAC